MDRKKSVDPHIGQRLKEYREHRGMTVRELADAARLTSGQICHYEHGFNRISHERVTEFARILRIKSDDLYKPPGSPLRRNHVRWRITNFVAAMIAEAAALVSSRKKVAAAADNEMLALSTAVAVAVSASAAAASDARDEKTSSLTISGDDTAVNISGSDSGVALEFNPVWGYRTAATVTDIVVADKLEIAGAVSQPGMLKIDPEILQLDGLDAANALVMTNGTSTETINLSRHYALDDSGDGRGDKIAAWDPPVSAAGETSVQSVAENGFSASNPFTETPNGNGNHSAFNFDNFKLADDNSVHPGKASVPAQHNDKSSPAVADKDHPAHPHDKFKFADDADDDSAHPDNAKGKDKDISAQSSDVSEDQFKTKLDDHHASADPKIDDIAKGHDNFKLADDDSAHPGNAKGEDESADAVMSDAASDQFIFGKGGHKKVEDTPDRIETDHTVIADIQDALQTAPDTNAVNALDANHTTAAQDMTKVPHHHGDFLT